MQTFLHCQISLPIQHLIGREKANPIHSQSFLTTPITSENAKQLYWTLDSNKQMMYDAHLVKEHCVNGNFLKDDLLN